MVTKIISNRFLPENKLLEIAASLEKQSEHPLANAVLDEAELEVFFRNLLLTSKYFPDWELKLLLMNGYISPAAPNSWKKKTLQQIHFQTKLSCWSTKETHCFILPIQQKYWVLLQLLMY